MENAYSVKKYCDSVTTGAPVGITVLKNGFWVAATTKIASLKPLTI